MSDLVARTGRHQQRYEEGYRLIAGYFSFLFFMFKVSILFGFIWGFAHLGSVWFWEILC